MSAKPINQRLNEDVFVVENFKIDELITVMEFGAKRKYPFEKMKNIGDGWKIDKMSRGKVYSAAKYFMQLNPDIKIVLMRDSENNSIIVRVK